MENLNISSPRVVGSNGTQPAIIRKFLLVCGILSSLLYIVINIVGAMQWPGYSSVSQAFSELIAIDAPSRPLVVLLSILYSILVYAFGVGVWMSAGQKRALRVAAVLIIGKEVLGLIITLFAPIHMRGVPGTLSDTLHGILTMVGVLLCMFPAMGFGTAAAGKKFRIYSFGTMAIFLVCGVLAGNYQSACSANLPTPWMGALERINIYGYMLWVVVFAIILLRQGQDSLNIEKRRNTIPTDGVI